MLISGRFELMQAVHCSVLDPYALLNNFWHPPHGLPSEHYDVAVLDIDCKYR